MSYSEYLTPIACTPSQKRMQSMKKTREGIALADDKNMKLIRMKKKHHEEEMELLKGQKGDLRSAGENAKMTSESSGGKVKRINVKRLNKEQRKNEAEKLEKKIKKQGVKEYKKKQKKKQEESDDSDSD